MSHVVRCESVNEVYCTKNANSRGIKSRTKTLAMKIFSANSRNREWQVRER